MGPHPHSKMPAVVESQSESSIVSEPVQSVETTPPPNQALIDKYKDCIVDVTGHNVTYEENGFLYIDMGRLMYLVDTGALKTYTAKEFNELRHQANHEKVVKLEAEVKKLRKQLATRQAIMNKFNKRLHKLEACASVAKASRKRRHSEDRSVDEDQPVIEGESEAE